MSSQELPTRCHILPAQVWGRLSVDRRTRALRLMTQMAFQYVTVQFDQHRKESEHVRPIRAKQNRS